MTRRDWVRLAQLDSTRAGMVIIAHRLREISAQQDEHAHRVGKAARASRGALAETASLSPARDLMLAYTADALARSKGTAADLDGAVEALELLVAGLRGR